MLKLKSMVNISLAEGSR